MKFFILIALLAPVASRFNETGQYAYKETRSCGGYKSTLSFKTCVDGEFCLSPIHEAINGTLVFKIGEEMKEPLFFTYSAEHFRRGRLFSEQRAIGGSTYLCHLVECPYKTDVEYRLPIHIPITRPYRDVDESKDVVRVTAVIDNIRGDLEVCAERDIIKVQ